MSSKLTNSDIPNASDTARDPSLHEAPGSRPMTPEEDAASLIGLHLMRTPEERLMVSARMSEMRANAKRIKEADDTISPS